MRAPPKTKKTLVEQHMERGALLLKTLTGDPAAPIRWTYSNMRGTARADVVEKLMAAGRLKPLNDGLFGDSQTYGLA